MLNFLSRAESSALYISVLTLGELRRGIAIKKATDPDSAEKLTLWVDGLEAGFADRVLLVDTEVARLWGELSAGRSRPVIDTLLAATALRHGLTLVTRNIQDVAGIAVPIQNPWAQTD